MTNNKYEICVRARCPVDPKVIDVYDFTIESASIIVVEKIIRFFNEHAGDKIVFQEALTQLCSELLGAKVTSVGRHSNVMVTCVCDIPPINFELNVEKL